MPHRPRSYRSSSRGPLGVLLRVLARPRATATVALLACACAIVTASPAPATATPLTRESLVTFEGQLNGHQVSGVTLHAKGHTLHASLKDGRKVIVAFLPAQQQRLLSDVRAQGITVKVAKVQPPPSHKTRYIVGGIVVVAIIIAAGGLLLYVRRRRMREDEHGPGYR